MACFPYPTALTLCMEADDYWQVTILGVATNIKMHALQAEWKNHWSSFFYLPGLFMFMVMGYYWIKVGHQSPTSFLLNWGWPILLKTFKGKGMLANASKLIFCSTIFHLLMARNELIDEESKLDRLKILKTIESDVRLTLFNNELKERYSPIIRRILDNWDSSFIPRLVKAGYCLGRVWMITKSNLIRTLPAKQMGRLDLAVWDCSDKFF